MSIAYYVAKYMSKSEPEAIRVPLRNVISVAQENVNENPRRKLFKQTKDIMRLRELGSQEAAFRACRLPLHKSSHATVFVPAFKRENRTRMVNKYTISSGNPSFCLNVIDKYKLRPRSPLFENICLFEFVAMYQVLSKNSAYTNMDEDYDEEFVEEMQNDRPKYPLFSDELNRCIILLSEAVATDENELEMSESLDDFFDDDIFDINTLDVVHNAEVFNAEDHLKQVSTLSIEQKRIFSSITASFNGRQEPKRIIAVGSGGAGKSYLIKIICNHIKFLTFGDLNNPVIVAAPTGVAARAIKGTTLHKAFKLPVEKNSAVQHKPLRGQNLQNLRNSLKNLKLVIIDEFSMMSYEVFRTIHLRLQEVFKNTELFGGISVMLVGDLLQLRPVKGNWIFCKPPKYHLEDHLWREFEYHELCVNHRQKNDPLLNVCNDLREGKITQEHIAILLPRMMDPVRPNYAEIQAEFKDA
ncbi:unnamed protein product, partial [Allacma fusca]